MGLSVWLRWGVGCFKGFQLEGDYAVIEFTGRRMVEFHKRFLPAGLNREMPFAMVMESLSSVN